MGMRGRGGVERGERGEGGGKREGDEHVTERKKRDRRKGRRGEKELSELVYWHVMSHPNIPVCMLHLPILTSSHTPQIPCLVCEAH